MTKIYTNDDYHAGRDLEEKQLEALGKLDSADPYGHELGRLALAAVREIKRSRDMIKRLEMLAIIFRQQYRLMNGKFAAECILELFENRS